MLTDQSDKTPVEQALHARLKNDRLEENIFYTYQKLTSRRQKEPPKHHEKAEYPRRKVAKIYSALESTCQSPYEWRPNSTKDQGNETEKECSLHQ